MRIAALVFGSPEIRFNSWTLWLFQLAEAAVRQGWQGPFGCVELRRVLPTDAAAQRRNGPQRSEKNVRGSPTQLIATIIPVISRMLHVNTLLLPAIFRSSMLISIRWTTTKTLLMMRNSFNFTIYWSSDQNWIPCSASIVQSILPVEKVESFQRISHADTLKNVLVWCRLKD